MHPEQDQLRSFGVSASIELDTDRIARSVIRWTIGAQLVLLVLDYVFNYYDLADDISVRRIFNIAREQSLPTFFASLQRIGGSAPGDAAPVPWGPRHWGQSSDSPAGSVAVASSNANFATPANARVHAAPRRR